jgi:hypothetical protein
LKDGGREHDVNVTPMVRESQQKALAAQNCAQATS